VRNTLFLALPSSVGLYLLSTDLVRLFYGAGEFLQNDGEAVIRTGQVVALLALGLCFYSLNSILARALYATKDTRAPTRSAAFSVVVNLALNLAFVLGTDLREAGLALASAISGASQTLFMLRALLKKTTMPDMKRMADFTAFVGGAAVAGGLGAWWVYTRYGSSQDVEGFLAFAIAGAVSLAPMALAGKVYFSNQLKALDSTTEAGAKKRTGPWPGDLVLYHSIYTTALSCMIMGLLVWAVRDSLPPGEGSFALVFQRGVVPVAAGVAVFLVAAGSVQSREYEEIKTAFARRMKKDARDGRASKS
jgi:peptidoglycan biosynthesis protein MviN/MurJ (putative lipid II flippase)